MLQLAWRMFLTIIIEIFIAFQMKFRTRKELCIIIGTNILTQIILNLLLSVSGAYVLGYFGLFLYLIYEIVVVIIEWNIYKKHLISHKKNDIKFYTVFANILSFIIGYMTI